ncbi:MAG: AAA domain-containing protein [Actinomycetia bacterium]|nr:AAA domain-containing protein [Actinomycetes bacterium]
MVKAIVDGIVNRSNYYFVGGSGIGKTSLARCIAEAMGCRVVYLNMGFTSIEDLVLPSPHTDEVSGNEVIKYRLLGEMAKPGPFVVIIDEVGQAEEGAANALMELANNKPTLGGLNLRDGKLDLRSVIMLDNPNDGKYGELNGLDLAQSDRFSTVFVGQADTPWQRALATKFSDTDLSSLFSWYNRLALDADGREILSPRVIDHMIQVVAELNMDGTYAVPMLGDRRTQITDASGNDTTAKVVEDFAKQLGMVNPSRRPDDAMRAMHAVIDHGVNAQIIGPQGVGKTSAAVALCEEKGVDTVYLSLPVMTREDLIIPVISECGMYVRMATHEAMSVDTGKVKVGIFDEMTRASLRTLRSVMEPLGSKSIAGQSLPGWKGVIALSNPSKVGAEEMMIEEEQSLAVAARFAIAMEIKQADIPWGEYLLATHGEDILPFVDWYRQDLANEWFDEDGDSVCAQDMVSPRCIERMFALHQRGLDIEWALPAPNGERVPVSLVLLKRRLSDQPVVSIPDIDAQLDDYVERMGARTKGGEEADPELHVAVYQAILNADVSLLETYESTVVEIIKVIAEQFRLKLLMGKGDRFLYFDRVLEAAFPEVH